VDFLITLKTVQAIASHAVETLMTAQVVTLQVYLNTFIMEFAMQLVHSELMQHHHPHVKV